VHLVRELPHATTRVPNNSFEKVFEFKFKFKIIIQTTEYSGNYVKCE
jgi:hypothetical protein